MTPRRTTNPAAEPQPSGYRQTGRGYIGADGIERVRVNLFLTPEQKAALKRAAADESDVSKFVVKSLGLPEREAA